MLKSALGRLLRRAPPRLQCWVMSWRSPASLPRGKGAYVHTSVQVLGRANVAIGANTVIGQDCWFNVNHRLAGRAAIRVGDNCFIGRRNFFSSGSAIVVGDFVLTANDCHFLGSSHRVDDPMRPVISTGTSDTDVITIGSNTFVGAGARVVGHVTIGHGCVIGAGSTVTRDLPPFTQAHGQPARISKRYSFLQRQWVDATAFTAGDEAALPSEAEYVVSLRSQGAIAMPYIAAAADLGDC